VGALVLVVAWCCVEEIASWRYPLGVHEVPPRGPGLGSERLRGAISFSNGPYCTMYMLSL